MSESFHFAKIFPYLSQSVADSFGCDWPGRAFFRIFAKNHRKLLAINNLHKNEGLLDQG
jgi:hypothetical protein